MSVYGSRGEAHRLAVVLGGVRNERPVVLGIPRGGVLLAEEIARTLGAPFDVVIAGKAFAPSGLPIAGLSADVVVRDAHALQQVGLAEDVVERLLDEEQARQLELGARLRGSRPMPDLTEHTVVIVDDAAISGLTMRAAIAAVAGRGARRIVAALPLCSTAASAAFASGTHEIIRLVTLPTSIAAQMHERQRGEAWIPLGDAELRERIAREHRDLGVDPYGDLTVDGEASR